MLCMRDYLYTSSVANIAILYDIEWYSNPGLAISARLSSSAYRVCALFSIFKFSVLSSRFDEGGGIPLFLLSS